jgi:hypothetical protein
MQPYTRRRLVKDFAMIIGVLLLPMLVYISLLFPDTKTLDISFISIDSGYLESIQVQFWLASIKLIHVITFLWWRATIKIWWRNVLILPALFFTWQFISCFDTGEAEFNGQEEFKYFIIFLIAAIIIIVQLINKLKLYIRQKETYKFINDEIDELLVQQINTIEKSSLVNIEKELKNLRKQREHMSDNDYLRSLIVLKSKLEL